MVLDDLGSSLRDTLDSLHTHSRLTEDDIDAIVKDIQRSLLQADVDVPLVTELSDNIRTRALREDPPAGTPVRDHVLRIVYEELVEFIGEATEIPLEPQTILLAGLHGSGKTTTAAKIAWWFSTKGLKPAIIQTDTVRPGAYDQTAQLAATAEVDFYGDPDATDPATIAQDGVAATTDADIRIVDTAGRHALDTELFNEIAALDTAVQPDYRLLVLDAAIGQTAKEQAREFDTAIGIDGVTITKLDGTAKGGGALAAVNEADTSIAFLGTGETVQDIERFEPNGFISRLLGMGDLQQLSERVERAMETVETTDEWSPEDLVDGEFTLRDMRHQLRAMDQMGPLEQVLDMVPGVGGNVLDDLPDDAVEVTQDRVREYEVVMNSMTDAELTDPSCVGSQRITRIARGSGTAPETVRELLQHHQQMKRTLTQFGGHGPGDASVEQVLDRFENDGRGPGSF